MPSPETSSTYEFSGFRLDCERFELKRDGHSMRVERKPMELLILLVSREGKLVTRAEIAERLWSSEVFVDTEHGINTAIRKLRQLLRDDSDEPQFIQTVTGMGYRFVAPVTTVAQPPRQPDGPVHDQGSVEAHEDNSAAQERSQVRSRKSVWITLGAFTVLLIVVFTVPFGGNSLAARLIGRGTRPVITSIAVLPLSNFSGDPSQEYIADGMTDELITMLAKDSSLPITSRTSVIRYKRSSQPLREIAQALHVDGIVEGSISRNGKQVHMTLQLIRADTDTHVWAESYDRDANEFAALPDEAARAIAVRLGSLSAVHASVRYVNPEAHDAYLRGHYYWTVGRIEEAGRLYRHAVELQPDYAAGWAGLCQYFAAGAFEGLLNPSEALPQAKIAGLKAVQLDDTLPQAHSVMAAAVFFNDWDGPRALQEVTRATELDPQFAEAFHLHALILIAMGRNQEALAIQKQSTAIDPFAHPAAMAEILMFTRQFGPAQDEAEMRLRDFPDAEDLMLTLMEIYRRKGMDRKSAEMLARLDGRIRKEGHPDEAILNAFKTGGYRQVVHVKLNEMERTAKIHYVSAVSLAHLYAELGEPKKTFALLDQAFGNHDPRLLFLRTDPAFDFLHQDPRYISLVKKMGMNPAG
jgi:TolB-like protein/DNA-binding winged helix-turn-helix (wHTH) protein